MNLKEPEAEVYLKEKKDEQFHDVSKHVNFAKSVNFSHLNACKNINYRPFYYLACEGTFNQSLIKSADFKEKKSKDISNSSFYKKSTYGKDSLVAWKSISITSLIPEQKLVNCDEGN